MRTIQPQSHQAHLNQTGILVRFKIGEADHAGRRDGRRHKVGDQTHYQLMLSKEVERDDCGDDVSSFSHFEGVRSEANEGWPICSVFAPCRTRMLACSRPSMTSLRWRWRAIIDLRCARQRSR